MIPLQYCPEKNDESNGSLLSCGFRDRNNIQGDDDNRLYGCKGSKSAGDNSESQDSQTDEEKWNAAKTSHSIRWQGNKIQRQLLQVLASRRKKPGAKL